MTASDDDDGITVEITIEASIQLTVDEVWPDGDQPEIITGQAVRDLMEACGDKRRTLTDWGLLDEVAVTVLVERRNPAWKQDETLLGEPPARYLREVEHPWSAASGYAIEAR